MAMEKKMKNNNNDKVELPQELIVEILLRLPVKSLLRFKCVSKSWFSIISADRFAKSHFDLSAAFNHRVLCFGDSELRSIHPDEMFNDNPATSIIKFIVPHPMNVHISIQGSCRGFLMLHQKPDLIIWNPSTGIFKRISYSHISQNLFGFRPDLFLFGFGYDASKDDYLVVIVLYNNIMGKFMECFSLKANKWEKHEITLRWNDIRYASSPGFYLNGAIHWDASSDYILAFNVIERVFFKIPLPKPLAQVFMSCCLELLGGFLSLTVWTQNNTTEIWVMKEYMVASSWISYKISERTFEPIYFTKGGEVIGLNSKGALEKYNIKGELLQHFPNCEYDYHFWMYTESLLSFPREEYDHH